MIESTRECRAAVAAAAIAVGAMFTTNVGAEPSSDAPSWSERIEWATDGPAAREHQSLMTFGDQVVIFGGSGYEPQGAPLGDAWAFDLTSKTWTALELAGDVPDPAGSRRVAQSPGADHAFLFGGYGANFETNNELLRVALRGDTLSFTSIEQHNPPAARALHAFAFDPSTETLIVTHGVSTAGFFDDTWVGKFDEENGVVWTELSDETRPSPRFGFSYGFDSDRGELIVLSGQIPGTAENPMPMSDELWALSVRGDAPSWRLIELDDPPVGRRNAMFAFDDATDRLAIWCGTADARTNVPGLVMVARDEGSDWVVTQHADNDAPPRRSSGVGFADPNSDAFYFGFGNSREGRYTDWVVFDWSPEQN